MHDFIQYLFYLVHRGIRFALPAALVCGLALVGLFWVFRKQGRRFPWGRAFCAVAMVGYLAMLVFVTLLRMDSSMGVSYVNFALFAGWRDAWNQWSLQAWLNLLLNVAVFVPWGILLPLLFRQKRPLLNVTLTGFLLSLVIESTQYFTGRGCFDLDDLFTNTLGAFLGGCFVLACRKLFCRRERAPEAALAYISGPVAFLLVLAGIFAAYQIQPYGNLPETPVERARVKGVDWQLSAELSDQVEKAPIYQGKRLDKAGADAFAAEFAQQYHIEFPDVSYYDHSAIYQNHSSGDFLRVDYYDGTWDYDVGKPSRQQIHSNGAAELDEAAARKLLEDYAITLPEGAEFQDSGYGWHTFTVPMSQVDGEWLYGTVRLDCVGEDSVDRIENHLVKLQAVGEVELVSEQEAWEKVQAGKFTPWVDFPEEFPLAVTGVRLDYQADTKGFMQPVYRFAVSSSEGNGEFTVPAMAHSFGVFR